MDLLILQWFHLEPVKYSDNKTVDIFFYFTNYVSSWSINEEPFWGRYLKMRNFDLFFNNFNNLSGLISMIFINFLNCPNFLVQK
jgi:hypothetical protein